MPKKSERTRQRIVEAANRLFYHKGYNQTSFTDVVQAAAVPRGNIYYYFKTKDEILESAIQYRLERIAQMLETWTGTYRTPIQRLPHPVGAVGGPAGLIRPPGAAIGIRGFDGLQPVRAVRGRVHLRRKPGDHDGVSVVGVLEHHRALVAGHGPGDAERQVVGLGARADEHANLQAVRKGRTQALGVLDHVLVQVARMRIESLQLPADSLGNVRVAMTHVRDVVVHVEVAPAVNVGQPHAIAGHDVQRRVVKQAIGAAKQVCTARNEVLHVGAEVKTGSTRGVLLIGFSLAELNASRRTNLIIAGVLSMAFMGFAGLFST